MKNSDWPTPGTVGMLLDTAGQASTLDPEGSLLLVQNAARAAEDLGLSCLVSRAYALWASVLAVLERLEESAQKFEKANLCDCCRSWVERLRSSLVIRCDGPEAAAEVSGIAVKLARSRMDTALGHATHGTILIHCDEFEEACSELSLALKMVPLKSSYWEAVRSNLSFGLSKSSDVATVREAVKNLREAPAGWVGIKGSVLPRANHAWMFGQALVRLVEVDDSLTPAEQQNFVSEAVDSINLALEKLAILGLHLEILACRTDLALILTRGFPLMAPEALRFDPKELDPEVLQALRHARRPGSTRVFVQNLYKLRNVTVEHGASSPILSYGNHSEKRIIAHL